MSLGDVLGAGDPDGRRLSHRGGDRKLHRGDQGQASSSGSIRTAVFCRIKGEKREAPAAGEIFRAEGPRGHAPEAGGGGARGAEGGQDPEAGHLRRVRPLL